MVLIVQNSTVSGIVYEAQQGVAAIISPNWTTLYFSAAITRKTER
jgi:hypothetical protein